MLIPHLDDKYCYSIKHYLTNNATLKALESNHIYNIKNLLNGNKIIDFVHFQTLINCNYNQGKHSYIALKQQLCESTNSNTIAPHVFMHVGKDIKGLLAYTTGFLTMPEYNWYEIFIDESKASKLNDNGCAYGVYYGHKNIKSLTSRKYNL